MLENVLKRDRDVVLAGLIAITLLAWVYLLFLAQPMDSTGSMGMGQTEMAQMGADPMAMARPQLSMWSTAEFLLTLAMWAVMMVAMMTPSAAPMILLYASIERKRQSRQSPFGQTGLFVVGYIVVWVLFSLAAASVQALLRQAALLSPAAATSAALGGLLLIAAGLFQFSPLKYRCLHHCRSPLAFLLGEWREGLGGAWRMGLRHGAYCLGCCWALMLLLFVAGVMNLLWVAALAVLILLEKVAPAGPLLGRVAGIIFLLWGGWLLIEPLLGMA
ncbi:MAG: DUF2182 domain-containing protein [Caldilineaceae bacterium]|nr:DUF2182 domain-containing protein [Caldilineaceae bacterium]